MGGCKIRPRVTTKRFDLGNKQVDRNWVRCEQCKFYKEKNNLADLFLFVLDNWEFFLNQLVWEGSEWVK